MTRAQHMTSPVVVGSRLLFLRSNHFTCVGLEEGTDGWVSGPTGCWSLVAEKRILALANTGSLRLINANPAEYDLAGQVDLEAGLGPPRGDRAGRGRGHHDLRARPELPARLQLGDPAPAPPTP